jgi:hypothetical protein
MSAAAAEIGVPSGGAAAFWENFRRQVRCLVTTEAIFSPVWQTREGLLVPGCRVP